jgi:AraC family transcriptional activator of pobA
MEHYSSISKLNKTNGYPAPDHPMVGLLTCQELMACSLGNSEFTSDFYIVALKKMRSGEFRYGRTKYDHESGSMYFVKPRQIVEINNIESSDKAFVILIHEDFLIGHELHAAIRHFGFFDYETNEAVHLSANEEATMWEIYHKIGQEVANNQDEYSREIILAHLNSLLKYSQRFYKRQFINRSPISTKMISKFNVMLENYFQQKLHKTQGLPTVKLMAEKLNTSARYLTDMLKQQTGKTALDHIHIFLIDEAKNVLRSSDHTIAETAYLLGFENPPYFTRLFKKETGLSPLQYKEQFLN